MIFLNRFANLIKKLLLYFIYCNNNLFSSTTLETLQEIKILFEKKKDKINEIIKIMNRIYNDEKEIYVMTAQIYAGESSDKFNIYPTRLLTQIKNIGLDEAQEFLIQTKITDLNGVQESIKLISKSDSHYEHAKDKIYEIINNVGEESDNVKTITFELLKLKDKNENKIIEIMFTAISRLLRLNNIEDTYEKIIEDTNNAKNNDWHNFVIAILHVIHSAQTIEELCNLIKIDNIINKDLTLKKDANIEDFNAILIQQINNNIIFKKHADFILPIIGNIKVQQFFNKTLEEKILSNNKTAKINIKNYETAKIFFTEFINEYTLFNNLYETFDRTVCHTIILQNLANDKSMQITTLYKMSNFIITNKDFVKKEPDFQNLIKILKKDFSFLQNLVYETHINQYHIQDLCYDLIKLLDPLDKKLHTNCYVDIYNIVSNVFLSITNIAPDTKIITDDQKQCFVETMQKIQTCMKNFKTKYAKDIKKYKMSSDIDYDIYMQKNKTYNYTTHDNINFIENINNNINNNNNNKKMYYIGVTILIIILAIIISYILFKPKTTNQIKEINLFTENIDNNIESNMVCDTDNSSENTIIHDTIPDITK